MTALEEIKKALEGVTPGPWKAVSEPHFDSGLVYTSVQPVNVDEEEMKPLAMANSEYHVCRMSHSAAPWRFNYHRTNARYIAAVNPVAIAELLSTLESLQRENEALKNLIDGDNCADPDKIDALFRRAEAAEAKVKRVREALQNVMGCYDTPLSRRRYPPDAFMTEAIDTARTTLASTGGEHHAE